VRIVIAEDAAVMQEVLVRMLEDRGHEVVAEAGEGDALLEEAREHRPDEAVVDIRMPSTCRPARVRD
jgi:DNA-binding NarL/FixJ family response regulator